MNDHTIIEVPGNDNMNSVIGEEYSDFIKKLDKLNEKEKENLKCSTTAILNKIKNQFEYKNNCRPTGLILGYVQSGKTLSFTALMALARDNNFGIVILLAGTTKILQDQSINRLKLDLGIGGNRRKWHVENAPTIRDYISFKNNIESWLDSKRPEYKKKSILIPLLKHHTHLKNLVKLLKSLNVGDYDLTALIIDDESDQASPNASVRKNKETPTHKNILELKQCFKRCAFIQYTATPQANLLAEKTSLLSPDFSHLLEPGGSYTGGKCFFDSPPQSLVTHIDPIEPDCERDDSLDQALMYYLIGLSDAIVKADAAKKQSSGNRTMLVHPSHLIKNHKLYKDQIEVTLDSWDFFFSNNGKVEKIDDLFVEQYLKLKSNYSELASIDEIRSVMSSSIKEINVSIINSVNGTKIDWDAHYAQILIGGMALDRGFTVEGLTVTHMARSVGENVYNADTLQQRARFFGYRSQYLPLCQIYIDVSTYGAFCEYVEHEEETRKALKEFDKLGSSIKDWARMFKLSKKMRPTRKNVHLGELIDMLPDGKWCILGISSLENPLIAETNLDILNHKIEKIDHLLKVNPSNSGDSESTKHRKAEITSTEWLRDLLNEFKFDKDELSHEQKTIMVQKLQSYGSLSIFEMSFGAQRIRKSEVPKSSSSWLFQGKTESGKKISYKGDSNVKESNMVSVQVHKVKIREIDGLIIPIIAIWIPKSKMETKVHKL